MTEPNKGLDGYRYWCETCHNFVADNNHRCEQWTSLFYLPPDAVKAISAEILQEAAERAIQWLAKIELPDPVNPVWIQLRARQVAELYAAIKGE